jgi:hypothetical protein
MNMDLKNQWPIMGFKEDWLLDSRCCPDIIDMHFCSMLWGLTVLHTHTALAEMHSAVWGCEAVTFGSLVEVGAVGERSLSHPLKIVPEIVLAAIGRVSSGHSQPRGCRPRR